MTVRMGNPVMVVPDALPALLALGKATRAMGVPDETLELINLRVSQLNGCAVCLDMHYRALRTAGLSEEKLAMVAAWRDAPGFSPEERAALNLAEAVTRLAEPDPVSDAVWDEAAQFYDEKQLGALILGIAQINLWNRINRSTGQSPQ
jgi:AhpD family alkylhydroperoxidase